MMNIVNALRKASIVFLYAMLLNIAIYVIAQDTPVEESSSYDEIISAQATKHGIDPLLVKALIWRESRFAANATGKAGEIGLMQISMGAVRDWAKANSKSVPEKEKIYDPAMNIAIGVWYLAKAHSNWTENPRQIELALCEYNAGRARLLRWIAHYDGSYDDVINSSASSSYVNAIVLKYTEYVAISTEKVLTSAN